MSADKRPGAAPEALPDFDVEEHEMAGVRSMQGNAFGRAGAKSHGPPRPVGPPPTEHLVAFQQPDLELDIAAGAFVSSRFRPAVAGVTCGMEPQQSAEEQDAFQHEAEKLADYGPVPRQPWLYGLYAWRVFTRRSELRREAAALHGVAAQSLDAYEKAVLGFADKTKQFVVRAGKKPPTGQRELVELAFRALDDARAFVGPELDAGRREVNGRQELYEKRDRSARLYDRALAAYDPRAFKMGAGSYVGGALFLVLFVFSPVIYRMISPPELPPLPPDPSSTAAP